MTKYLMVLLRHLRHAKNIFKYGKVYPSYAAKMSRLYLLSNSQVLRLLSISKCPSFFDKILTILFSGVNKFKLVKKVKLEAVDSMSSSSSASESQSDAEEYANSGEELSESESVSSEESIERSTHKTVELSVSQAAFGEKLDAIIVACEGMFKEKMNLSKEVALLDEKTKKILPLELWVSMLEHSMTETVLLDVCKQLEVLDEIWSDMSTIDPEHFQASVNNLRNWIFAAPIFIASIAKCVNFSYNIEKKLRFHGVGGLNEVQANITRELSCASSILTSLKNDNSGNDVIDSGSIIDERNRKFRSISCHILHLLHLKDIVSHLIADGVESVGDFNFQTIFRQVILDKAPQSARRLNVNLGLLAKSKYKGEGTLLQMVKVKPSSLP